MYDTVPESYNDFPGIYFHECNKVTDAKINTMELKYDPDNLFCETYNYDDWFENEESTDITRESDKEESDMPPLEGDEIEVKEKRIKNLNSKQIISQTSNISSTNKIWK